MGSERNIALTTRLHALLRRLITSGLLTLILCVAYSGAMTVVAPGFSSWENAGNVLDAMLPLMVVATGQTIVLMTAGIDLSVTSIIALTSVLGAWVITADDGWLSGSVFAVPIGMMVMIGTGALLGAINGGCIAWLRLPPFMMTLTSMIFVSGLAVWLTQSEPISNLPPSFLAIGKHTWIAATVTCLVSLAAHLMLTRTLLGMRLRNLGHNRAAATVAGVRVAKVTLLAYILCGVYAAIASILIMGQLETGSPVQWENNLLDVIGATVIGGTSLYGGRGSVAWTFAGVLLLTLIDNSLNLMGLSHFTIMMAKGGVILVAALLDSWRTRMESQ